MSKRKKSKRKAKRKLQKRLKELGWLERADLATAVWATEANRKIAGGRLAAAGELADQPPLLAACLGVAGLGLVRNDKRMIRAGVNMLAAFTAATATKEIGKALVGRTRPDELADEGRYARELFGPHTHPWDAFPSGHTAGAVAVARALAREFPELERLLTAAAVAAGLLKVAKGDHYPSDVLAGLILGAGVEKASQATVSRAAHAL